MNLKKIILSFFLTLSLQAKTQVATFAGGCFWCMEPPYEKLDGVNSVISGYMGGSKENAKYDLVSGKKTKHLEVVQVNYDDEKVSYQKLVDIFWRNINPTQDDGQFVDKGDQYLSAIFYHSKEQESIAEKSKEKLAKSKRFKKPIVTKIRKAMPFYPAEDYHQDYYKKSTIRYKYYRFMSGRDQFLNRHWPESN